MDGVDTTLFKFKEYSNDILTKKRLKIGWIGDSNPKASGIQKGYNEIKQYISDLSANFEFCPLDKQIKQIPHNKVPEYIYNIDIIICYSTCEGTPNQILESSSCGRCWISTNVGIVSSVYNTLPNNPTGIIINKNEQSLKKALMFLYNNRKLIVELGINGRKAIQVKWDWKNRLDGFKKLIDEGYLI
jgi:glycosyltransferase involved in cell wall biosynthesis